jgi:hypothetical protein
MSWRHRSGVAAPRRPYKSSPTQTLSSNSRDPRVRRSACSGYPHTRSGPPEETEPIDPGRYVRRGKRRRVWPERHAPGTAGIAPSHDGTFRTKFGPRRSTIGYVAKSPDIPGRLTASARDTKVFWLVRRFRDISTSQLDAFNCHTGLPIPDRSTSLGTTPPGAEIATTKALF